MVEKKASLFPFGVTRRKWREGVAKGTEEEKIALVLRLLKPLSELLNGLRLPYFK